MAGDYESMAKKLFQLTFAKELDEKPKMICCTHSDGKQLLNQEHLKGIRCKCLYVQFMNFQPMHLVHPN